MYCFRASLPLSFTYSGTGAPTALSPLACTHNRGFRAPWAGFLIPKNRIHSLLPFWHLGCPQIFWWLPWRLKPFRTFLLLTLRSLFGGIRKIFPGGIFRTGQLQILRLHWVYTGIFWPEGLNSGHFPLGNKTGSLIHKSPLGEHTTSFSLKGVPLLA